MPESEAEGVRMVTVAGILVVAFELWLIFGEHGFVGGGGVTVVKKPTTPRPPAPKPQGMTVKHKKGDEQNGRFV